MRLYNNKNRPEAPLPPNEARLSIVVALLRRRCFSLSLALSPSSAVSCSTFPGCSFFTHFSSRSASCPPVRTPCGRVFGRVFRPPEALGRTFHFDTNHHQCNSTLNAGARISNERERFHRRPDGKTSAMSASRRHTGADRASRARCRRRRRRRRAASVTAPRVRPDNLQSSGSASSQYCPAARTTLFAAVSQRVQLTFFSYFFRFFFVCEVRETKVEAATSRVDTAGLTAIAK